MQYLSFALHVMPFSASIILGSFNSKAEVTLIVSFLCGVFCRIFLIEDLSFNISSIFSFVEKCSLSVLNEL